MTTNVFRFEFEPSVPIVEAELTLHLAMYAVEGLFGSARVRLDASYNLNDGQRVITVDAGNETGAAIVKVYTGLLLREFGEAAFRVRAMEVQTPETSVVPAGALA